MTRKNELSLLAKSGASLIAIVAACGSSAALAQETSGTNAPAATAPDPATPTISGQAAEEPQASSTTPASQEIIVVGTRASQQSAIDRKKRAKTATDSIVADDIGSFPDRNVSEAMSRLPGVALNRGEFGEGEGVSIRGNSMGQTRVELDGVGVQSTAGLALGIDNGRSADTRELPAELVKSIDVTKGTTADMTEGSLGGGIQIQTRSGLDFKKPYASLRIGAQRNSLSHLQDTPDLSAILTRKFFGDRLGVIVSGTYTRRRNDSHRQEVTTSGQAGYNALYDFDNSPEKTFEFNPDTVGTDAADVAFANSIQADGTGLTPRELVTLSANAQTKADCLNLFPNTATLDINQRPQRILEQNTCLNQWNDYTPSNLRDFVPYQDEKRTAFDARADYKVTDNLTVYGKVTRVNRKVDDNFISRSPTSMIIENENGSWTYGNAAGTYPRIRAVSPGADPGFYLYGVPTAQDPFNIMLNHTGAGTELALAERNRPIYGNVLNVVPGSVVVDENHNVTQYTTTNNSVTLDQIVNEIDAKTRFVQAGAEWRLGRLELDALVGRSKAATTRTDFRTGRGYEYGQATMTLQPNGLWNVETPENYNPADVNNYVQLAPARCIDGGVPPNCRGQNAVPVGPNNSVADPNYTVAQMPLRTPLFSTSFSPRLGQASEKIAKLDATFATDDLIPFFTRVKTGVMLRKNDMAHWGSGGKTVSSALGTFGTAGYIPAVILPRNDVRGNVRACAPTPTSSAPGGLSCDYGFVPSEDPLLVRQGLETVTEEELRRLFGSSVGPYIDFMRGLPNGGDLPEGWNEINSQGLFQQLDAYQFMNFDCLKRCTASDGQVYDQPVNRSNETIKNIYAMTEFELGLPLGLRFDGNVGVRGVFRKVQSTGSLIINYTSLLPTGAVQTQTFSQNVDFTSKRTDWLPSVNLNLWGFNDSVVLRAYGGRTVSQPTPGRLIPSGTCTIDDREFQEADGADPFGCSGRIGNPNLKPFTARSRNLSLEWYPNRDTMLSVAYGKLNVLTADPIAVTQQIPLLSENPVTGEAIDATFNVPTWENGPGFKRKIWEFAGRTAFTWAPWFLRHTGVDANYSKVKSTATQGGIRDPLTGDVMDPIGQSKYFTNLSLWYDDGRLNLRVAYQARGARFSCITACGGTGNQPNRNYPGEGYNQVTLGPIAGGDGYVPGIPRFDDADRFIDAKMSYNLNKYLQVYFEARNVTREVQTASAGDYEQFADGTPRIMKYVYAGRRFMGGLNIRFGAGN